jgi:hypothetical protein
MTWLYAVSNIHTGKILINYLVRTLSHWLLYVPYHHVPYSKFCILLHKFYIIL